MTDPRERLIVALDVPSVAEAEAMVARLGNSVVFYKIGYQLGFAGGLDFARALTDTGKQIFIDMKLHDIGNTVAQGVKSIAQMGATFLTVHAYPQTMHAAVDARAGSELRILAVTVLTSYDDADLAAAGYDFTVPELVGGARRAGARYRRRRPRLLGAGSGEHPSDRRQRHDPGDAGDPAGRRRRGRSEAHHDAVGGDQGRRQLSRGRPAGGGGRIRRRRPTRSSRDRAATGQG